MRAWKSSTVYMFEEASSLPEVVTSAVLTFDALQGRGINIAQYMLTLSGSRLPGGRAPKERGAVPRL